MERLRQEARCVANKGFAAKRGSPFLLLLIVACDGFVGNPPTREAVASVGGPEAAVATSQPSDAGVSDAGPGSDAGVGQTPEGNSPPPTPPTPPFSKKQYLTYIAIPHPDDEYGAWGLIEGREAQYSVFVLMTHGEQTGACSSPSDGTGGGPYWYQGPGGPVGQPNYGEAVYGNPWVGRWTQECSDARLHGWHRMLDQMALLDSTLPYAPELVGRYCPSGVTPGGLLPTRYDGTPPVGHPSACADVYANALGARVVFDLGDSDLTSDEVLWAIQSLRENRGSWGIPPLPEKGIIGAAFYNATSENSGIAQYSACSYYGHPDHHAIQVALWGTQLGAGSQLGRTCDSDPDVTNTGGTRAWVSSPTHLATFAINPATHAREGPIPVNYGWLFAGETPSCEAGCGWSRQQAFWRR